MNENDCRLWPFKPRIGIFVSITLLVGLLIITSILRYFTGWPPASSDSLVLVGILLVSLLPIVLAIVDILIERGGVVEYGNIKIDFSKVQRQGVTSITVPANIGVRGQPVIDTGTANILDALGQAISNSIVIIDLEDGQAWWETRLLVLLSGAQRLGCPDKIVFVATKSGKPQSFIAWANPCDLFKCLLKANPKYLRAYYVTKAVSSQWGLVEPLYPVPPQNVQLPNALPWMQAEAQHKTWMAFDQKTGLPNELFEEQVLQNELGREIESQEGGKFITITSLRELFESVLNRNHVDQNWPVEEQMKGYFEDDASVIAITENGTYSSLVSRLAVFNEMLKNLSAV